MSIFTSYSSLLECLNNLISTTSKGISQIMLQENRLTGGLFLLGIFYGSWRMGIAAILATISGTSIAKLLKFYPQELKNGIYGFSAALVGVACLLFFKSQLSTWILVAAGGILATLLQHLFLRLKIPVFTLPFILVTWLLLFVVQQFNPELLVIFPYTSLTDLDYFTFAIKGFGQVIFQDNLIAGTLFFIGVLISSPIAALYGLASAVLSGVLATFFAIPIQDIANGLLSFNADFLQTQWHTKQH